MPSYNVTLDDVSPLWRYSDNWNDSDKADGAIIWYSNQTFHSTSNVGSTVGITFNGTGIHLYGAFRDNHDEYTVTVAGQRVTGNSYRGGSNAQENFQLPLYNRTDLPAGLHEVILTDASTRTDRLWLDLDFGIITLGDGDASTKSVDTILDDTATPSITYAGDWIDTQADTSSAYYKGTMHRVNVQGAKVTIKFYGNAIQVYGAASSNHGPYTVSLDGLPTQNFNGRASDFRPQQMIYLASSLELADHTVVIEHTSADAAVWFDLDYALVSVWPDTADPAPAPSSNDKKTPVGAIAGGVVGGVVGLLLLGLLAFFIWRRRRRGGQWDSQEKFEVDPIRPSAGAGAVAAGTVGAAAGHHRSSEPESGGGYLRSPSEGAYLRTPTVVGSEAGATSAYGESEPGPHEPLLGHIDLPPPGYDQVLRNTQPTTIARTSEAAPSEVGSSSAAGTSSSGMQRGVYPPEKGSRVSVPSVPRRALPTTPPTEES